MVSLDLLARQEFEAEWSLVLVAPVGHHWRMIDEPTRQVVAEVVG
jgi:hypothetical protein